MNSTVGGGAAVKADFRASRQRIDPVTTARCGRPTAPAGGGPR